MAFQVLCACPPVEGKTESPSAQGPRGPGLYLHSGRPDGVGKGGGRSSRVRPPHLARDFIWGGEGEVAAASSAQGPGGLWNQDHGGCRLQEQEAE